MRPFALIAWLAMAWLGMAGDARAQIYAGHTGESGSVVLSNFESADAPDLLVAMPQAPPASQPAGPAARKPGAALPHAPPKATPELRRVIDEVAREVSIAPELLHAVIAAESAYDVRALSPRGAMGLMQLLPATARRFGVRDPYAPRDNVMGGASYLKWLMSVFDNDLTLVLAAYNAGEQAVMKAGRQVPPFAETQAYVPRVLSYLRCTPPKVCKFT